MRREMLQSLISAGNLFHASTCQVHRKICNAYCLRCGGNPICLLCKEENEHVEHLDEVIQVYSATRKNAVQEQTVGTLLSTSDIQKLINNGKNVVYILSRRSLRAQEEGVEVDGRTCKTCTFRLPVEDPEIKFCSINCKVLDAASRWGSNENEKQCTDPKPSSSLSHHSPELSTTNIASRSRSGSSCCAVAQSPETPTEVVSFRKRSRKLKPHRAPFM